MQTYFFRYFLDDIIRQKWGDLIAVFLILMGIWLVMHGTDETVKDTGKGLIGSGLITLRPKGIDSNAQNGNGNGNGAVAHSTGTITTKVNETVVAPATVPAAVASATLIPPAK